MEINLKTDNEEGAAIKLTLTNEDYNNFNFVGLIIEGKEYDLILDELYEAVFTFKRIKDEDDEREEV